MKEIAAYRCEATGKIFERPGHALYSEFKSKLYGAGNKLSAPPCPTYWEWLAENISGNVYPLALPNLLDALNFLKDNLEEIQNPYGKT